MIKAVVFVLFVVIIDSHILRFIRNSNSNSNKDEVMKWMIGNYNNNDQVSHYYHEYYYHEYYYHEYHYHEYHYHEYHYHEYHYHEYHYHHYHYHYHYFRLVLVNYMKKFLLIYIVIVIIKILL